MEKEKDIDKIVLSVESAALLFWSSKRAKYPELSEEQFISKFQVQMNADFASRLKDAGLTDREISVRFPPVELPEVLVEPDSLLGKTSNGEWFSQKSLLHQAPKKDGLIRIVDFFRARDTASLRNRARIAYALDIGSSLVWGYGWAASQANPSIGHLVGAEAIMVTASFAEFFILNGWRKINSLKEKATDPANKSDLPDIKFGMLIANLEVILGVIFLFGDLYTTGLLGSEAIPGLIGASLGAMLLVLTTIWEGEYHLAQQGIYNAARD